MWEYYWFNSIINTALPVSQEGCSLTKNPCFLILMQFGSLVLHGNYSHGWRLERCCNCCWCCFHLVHPAANSINCLNIFSFGFQFHPVPSKSWSLVRLFLIRQYEFATMDADDCPWFQCSGQVSYFSLSTASQLLMMNRIREHGMNQIWSFCSVRVSNELGGGKPNTAKLSVLVNVLTSGVLGIIFAVTIIATRDYFPLMFTDKPRVTQKTSKLGYLLAATIFLNSIQPVLHGKFPNLFVKVSEIYSYLNKENDSGGCCWLFVGVAVGAGWQFSVALLNVVCYYVIGLPMGAVLGYKLNLGIQGIWWAMLGGSLLQTIVLLIIIIRTNWLKEVRFFQWNSTLCQIMPLNRFLQIKIM